MKFRTRLKDADKAYCQGAGQVAKLARRRTNLKALLAKVSFKLKTEKVGPYASAFPLG